MGAGEGDCADKRVDFEVDYLERVPPEMVRRDLAVEDFHAYAAPFHRMGQKTRISVPELRQSLLIFQDRWVFKSLAQQLGGGGEGEFEKMDSAGSPGGSRSCAGRDRVSYSSRNGRPESRSGKGRWYV